jgi:hypothetical protein
MVVMTVIADPRSGNGIRIDRRRRGWDVVVVVIRRRRVAVERKAPTVAAVDRRR